VSRPREADSGQTERSENPAADEQSPSGHAFDAASLALRA
jgi:hypothetical protein